MIEKKEIYMNYKRQNKWMGIIDYKTLTIVIGYIIIIFYIIKSFNLSFSASVNVYSVLITPAIALMFINNKNGSAIEILIIILKFLINRKIFVDTKYYKKDKLYKYVK